LKGQALAKDVEEITKGFQALGEKGITNEVMTANR
jgi:hypothetical protein